LLSAGPLIIATLMKLSSAVKPKEAKPMSPSNKRGAHAFTTNLGLALVAVLAQFAFVPLASATPGDLFVTDLATGSVIRYAPDGTPTTFASGLISPQGIVFFQGNSSMTSALYVADAGNGGATSGVVYRYDLAGTRTTFATSLDNPIGLAVDGGTILVAENGAGRIKRLPVDGSPGTVSLTIANPLGIDAHGSSGGGFFTTYIATGASVFQVAPGGLSVDIDPGDNSRAVMVDFATNVFVTTDAGTISEIPANGSPKFTFASGLNDPHGIAFVPPGLNQGEGGFVYVADTAASTIYKIAPGFAPAPFVTGGSPNFLIFQTNGAPTVVTMTATSVASTMATLHGTVNPNGSATTYKFSYGKTTSYGSSTPETSAGTGTTTLSKSAVIAGLLPSTTYHFQIVASNKVGSSTGSDLSFTTLPPNSTPIPTPTPTPPDTALNISTRVDVETGDDVGIGGFIITGTDPKMVVIRGLGPSLSSAVPPVAGALSDPLLELHDSTGAIIATNDNWMTNSVGDQTTLANNGLAPADDLEAALVRTLDPGAYTAIIKGSHGEMGVALVEAYNLDDPGAAGELANISTRGFVGTTSNVLIGGIIVGPVGGTSATAVVRAIGPSLLNANPPIANALLDPVLELHNGAGDLIALSDNWQTDAAPSNYSAQVIAAGLAPTADAESAIYATLSAGSYTAIVSGKDGTSGVGLVEVYHVPAQP
jgi:hypothetical protein